MSDDLNEIKLKHVIAAGAIAAAAITGGSSTSAPKHIDKQEQAGEARRMSFKSFALKQDAKARRLAMVITDNYAIGTNLALKVAKLAIKHQKPGFPSAEDLLAVCGVESSFDPDAVSNLKHDPAVGLLQVRPAVWGLNKAKLASSVEEQIKIGSEILHKYYQKLKSKDAALHAYNIGMTNYMKQKGLNPSYPRKVKDELALYEQLTNVSITPAYRLT